MTFLKNKLLEQIKNGEIKLKPKWIFVVRFFGLIIGAALSILITIFFVSIILFIVFYNKDMVQHKDLMTFKMLFSNLPWAIIGLAMIFVVIFEVFIKKLLPLYRKPMLITLTSLVLLIMAISFGVNQSKAFQSLCGCNSSKFKPLEWILKKQEKNYNNLIKKGKIKEIKGKEIIVELADGQVVMINKNNFCKNCIDNIQIQNEVILSGINSKDGFKPLKGKKDENCSDCGLKNEIKPNNGCNNIWKGREKKQK